MKKRILVILLSIMLLAVSLELVFSGEGKSILIKPEEAVSIAKDVGLILRLSEPLSWRVWDSRGLKGYVPQPILFFQNKNLDMQGFGHTDIISISSYDEKGEKLSVRKFTTTLLDRLFRDTHNFSQFLKGGKIYKSSVDEVRLEDVPGAGEIVKIYKQEALLPFTKITVRAITFLIEVKTTYPEPILVEVSRLQIMPTEQATRIAGNDLLLDLLKQLM